MCSFTFVCSFHLCLVTLPLFCLFKPHLSPLLCQMVFVVLVWKCAHGFFLVWLVVFVWYFCFFGLWPAACLFLFAWFCLPSCVRPVASTWIKMFIFPGFWCLFFPSLCTWFYSPGPLYKKKVNISSVSVTKIQPVYKHMHNGLNELLL